MRPMLILLLTAASIQMADADTLYRWVDKEGKVHYGDQPAVDAVKSEPKRFKESVEIEEDELPYETRLAMKNFPVTFYINANCDETCDQARKYLDKRGIPYTEKETLTRQDIETIKTTYGITLVPSLTIGKTGLNGFRKSSWENELDLAGYPKSPGYRKLKTAKSKQSTSDTEQNNISPQK